MKVAAEKNHAHAGPVARNLGNVNPGRSAAPPEFNPVASKEEESASFLGGELETPVMEQDQGGKSGKDKQEEDGKIPTQFGLPAYGSYTVCSVVAGKELKEILLRTGGDMKDINVKIEIAQWFQKWNGKKMPDAKPESGVDKDYIRREYGEFAIEEQCTWKQKQYMIWIISLDSPEAYTQGKKQDPELLWDTQASSEENLKRLKKNDPVDIEPFVKDQGMGFGTGGEFREDSLTSGEAPDNLGKERIRPAQKDLIEYKSPHQAPPEIQIEYGKFQYDHNYKGSAGLIIEVTQKYGINYLDIKQYDVNRKGLTGKWITHRFTLN